MKKISKSFLLHLIMGLILMSGIISLFTLKNSLIKFIILLLLETITLLTIRFYKQRMAMISFIIVLTALLFSGFPEEIIVAKIVNIIIFIFTGFIIFFFLRSIQEADVINRSFIDEESKKITYLKKRLEELEEQNKNFKEQLLIWQQLSTFLKKTSNINNSEQLLSLFAEQTAKFFTKGTLCLICMRNLEKDENWIVKASSDPDKKFLGDISPDNLDSIAKEAGIPVIIENRSEEINFKIECKNNFNFESAIVVYSFIDQKSSSKDSYENIQPLNRSFQTKLDLTLKCYHEKPKSFNTQDLRILQYVSETMAIELQNSLLFKETERLAQIDGITGLYVQHYLIEKIDEEIERHKKTGSIFSLIIMDIDDFKTFNDTYGHLAGDYILGHVASIIKSNIRAPDFPSRYGGDEFFLILPETDTQNAKNVAERIRIKIFESSENLKYNNIKIERRLSASFGVSEYFSELGDTKSFIRYVDSLMYTAKQNGKNQVVTGKIKT